MVTGKLLAEVEAELVRAEKMLAALDESIAQCRDWLGRSELMRAEAIKLCDSLRVAVGKMKDASAECDVGARGQTKVGSMANA